MEVQFEVVSCLEKKHYVQWYQHILRRRILWVILFSFVGFVSLLLGIKNADYGDLIYAGVCAVYVIWNYRRPWILAKKHLKRDVEYYGTQEVSSVTTFGETIRDVTKDTDMTMPYDKIKDIHISKDLIALEDVKKQAFLMDKNGFTKGDFQSFLAFIGEKCPQLKLPNW